VLALRLVKKIAMSVLLSASASASLAGQAPTQTRKESLDLALLQPSKTDTVYIAAGKVLEPTIVNEVAKAGYRYYANVSLQRIEQPVFVSPGRSLDQQKLKQALPIECEAPALKSVNDAFEKVKSETDELAVARSIDRLNSIAAEEITACKSAEPDIRRIKVESIRITTMQLLSYVIEPQTALVIEVVRTGPDVATLTWKRVYSPPEQGKWRTGFGGAFILGYHTEDRFYIDPADSTVKESNRRAGSTLVPAVFYSWQSFNVPRTETPLAIVAGLALDLAHPILTLGLGTTFYDNVNVSAGISAFEGNRLKSQYRPGTKVPGTIQHDDLFEKRYYAKPYFAVAYRFSSNPFGGTNAPSPKPNTPPPPSPISI